MSIETYLITLIISVVLGLLLYFFGKNSNKLIILYLTESLSTDFLNILWFKIGLKKSGNGVMIKISNILPKKHSNFLLQWPHCHNQKAQ